MKIAHISVADWALAYQDAPLELEAVGWRLTVRLYGAGGTIPDDDAANARALRLDVRTWRRLKAELLRRDLFYLQDGHIGNERVDVEVAAYTAHRENGRKGGRPSKSAQLPTNFDPEVRPTSTPKSDRSQADVAPQLALHNQKNQQLSETTPTPSISEVKKREESPPPPLQGAEPVDALKAFERWNATALRCGLPQAAKLTPDRQRRIRARLKEYGLDGWDRALANIEKSAFLTGKNDKGFRADLDFLLQAKSFGKTHDGAYGNGRHAETPPSTVRPPPRPLDEAALGEAMARKFGYI